MHKHFGKVHAVDGIDLHLEIGEIAALLGPMLFAAGATMLFRRDTRRT